MTSSRSPTEFDQNNRDVTSILGYVIKKKQQSWSQARTFWTTKDVLPGEADADKGTSEKGRTPPNDTFTMVRDEEYRKSLSAIWWEEHHVMLYDRIAEEKHIYVATRGGRTQNSKHWILTINVEGPQQLLNQRPDCAQAKRECKRLHDQYVAKTQQEYRTNPRDQQVRHRK